MEPSQLDPVQDEGLGRYQKQVFVLIALDILEFVPQKEIAEVLGFVRAEARRRGIVVETALAGNIPEIRGDKIQLQQVVLNLLMNGMESMTDVVGTRRLSVTTCLHENSAVTIAVTDSGIGIPPHQLPRLFQHFFSTKKNGMGLGLSIVRSLIESHGGTICAENNADGGATFRLTIPIDSDGMRPYSQRIESTLLELPS